MNSNMLGVQSDCPHREKIQYGGDSESTSYHSITVGSVLQNLLNLLSSIVSFIYASHCGFTCESSYV
jgi:hypothetical protein